METLKQLQAIERAAHRFVDLVGSNQALRMQFDSRHKTAWDELVRALFDGRSLYTRMVDEQRDAARDAKISSLLST